MTLSMLRINRLNAHLHVLLIRGEFICREGVFRPRRTAFLATKNLTVSPPID